MTDTPTPHKATPEQWEHLENGALIDRPYNSARVVLELRDRIVKLERMRETEKACILEIYDKLDKLKLDHESNWARIVKLEEAQDAAPAAEPAPAPAGSLVEVVAAIVADGIACDREEERIAPDLIVAVAGWLEHGDRECEAVRLLRREAGR